MILQPGGLNLSTLACPRSSSSWCAWFAFSLFLAGGRRTVPWTSWSFLRVVPGLAEWQLGQDTG